MITTRAMRGDIQVEKEVAEQEEYTSNDVEAPHLSNLDKVANVVRHTTKALTR